MTPPVRPVRPRPTIAVDMDGVLVEHNADYMRQINEEFGTSYTYDQITTFTYEHMAPEHRERVFEFWHSPVYDGCEPEPLAMEGVDALREYGRVIICTSPLLGHIESKYRWLTDRFAREDIVLASDKTLVDADILIDDGPHNIYGWQKLPGRTAWIFDRPWNRHVEGYRVFSWGVIASAPTEIVRIWEEDNLAAA